MAEAIDPDEGRPPRGNGGSDANSVVLTSSSSFSSALSSSDTESTTSFFQERSTTLASLIGIAGGDAVLANADAAPPAAPVVAHGITPIHALIRSATSTNQEPKFTPMNRVRSGGKLRSLLPCGACKGLCNANRGACGVFCRPKKGNSDAEPPAAALGHLLVAERHAERSLDRGVNGSPSVRAARVYLNIIYEENAGLEQAAMNPLFNLNSAATRAVGRSISSDQVFECSTTQAPPDTLREQAGGPDVLPSSALSAEDGPHVTLVETRSIPSSIPVHALAEPHHP